MIWTMDKKKTLWWNSCILLTTKWNTKQYGNEYMSKVSYSSQSFPSFFGPKHLGKSPKWKVESFPHACSQVLHLATAMAAAAATHKHRTTQDGELALPDSLHKILILHNRSTGLGICPTRLKLFSLSLSVFCLSGLPLTLVPSKVEMAIGSAEWLKAGELFSQVPAKWGEQHGRNSNPLEEPKGSSPFPLCVTPPHRAPILWLSTCLTLLSSLYTPPPPRLRSCSDRHKQWKNSRSLNILIWLLFLEQRWT